MLFLLSVAILAILEQKTKNFLLEEDFTPTFLLSYLSTF